MFGLGTTEILIFLAVGVIFFGAKRLPTLGKGLGEGLRGFRDSLRGASSESEAPAVDEEPKVLAKSADEQAAQLAGQKEKLSG